MTTPLIDPELWAQAVEDAVQAMHLLEIAEPDVVTFELDDMPEAMEWFRSRATAVLTAALPAVIAAERIATSKRLVEVFDEGYAVGSAYGYETHGYGYDLSVHCPIDVNHYRKADQ